MVAALKTTRWLAVLVCVGCASEPPPLMPDRLMDSREAFPSLDSTSPPPGSPGASRTLSFNASFEDVYRAASVSASQAQFVVDDEQKSRGLILASRSFKANPYSGALHPMGTDHRFYYAIALRELAPKRTEVRIAAKVQGRCRLNDMRFLIAVAGLSSSADREDATCIALSKGTWSGAKHSADEDLARFMTFLRNNLIAAGVL